MKLTMRKNGRLMFDVSVVSSAGREELIMVVTDYLVQEVPAPKSRRDIVALLRSAAKSNGHYLTYNGEEDCGPERDVLKAAEKRAVEIVDALFPELKPAG